MKVLVAVKRVVDYQVKVRVSSDGQRIESLGSLKMSMNPFDEIAVEEALRLKEKGVASEVILVSIDGDSSKDTLRHGLALGADRAILVKAEETFEPINIAKILKKIAEDESAELIFLGKQAIDDDCNQTGQMLAGMLNWPQATFISKIDIENGEVTVLREVDRGLQTIKMNLPAIVTTDLRLNTPRFVSLPNIMKSKMKPLKEITVDELDLDLKAHSEILKMEMPQTREAGIKVGSISEVLTILKEKHGVIS